VPKHPLKFLLAVAGFALVFPVASSQGAAETGTFTFGSTVTEPVDLSDTCLGPGAVGTVTSTESGVGHFTENGPPAFGFHDHGTITTEFRMVFDDGRTLNVHDVSHFGDNATHNDRFESKNVIQNSGTIYGPDGSDLGTATLHWVQHVTYQDADGDHQPGPGEVISSVDRMRLTCR